MGYFNPSFLSLIDWLKLKEFWKQYVDEKAHENLQLYATYRIKSPENISEQAPWTYCRANLPPRSKALENDLDLPCRPKLSMMLQSHLIERLCILQVIPIDYLFKYIFKGHDHIALLLVKADPYIVKISKFQDAWYTSATESFCPLFQFDIVERAATALRFDDHLENHHNVYFCNGRQSSSKWQERPGTRTKVCFEDRKKLTGGSHIKTIGISLLFSWKNSTKWQTPRKAKESYMYCSSKSSCSVTKWRVWFFQKSRNGRWTYLHRDSTKGWDTKFT